VSADLIRVADAALLLGSAIREMLDVPVVDRVCRVVHEDGDKVRVRRADVEKLDAARRCSGSMPNGGTATTEHRHSFGFAASG
jgi:hypothetical protein